MDKKENQEEMLRKETQDDQEDQVSKEKKV